MARRLPEDPGKRRLQVFKRVFQHLEHWQALMEDRGMGSVITDPETGEDIYIADLLVGLDSLPPRQRQAFELICLKGYTETAARDVLLPNSKSSTPVQQYADSGLVRVVQAYDLYQRGEWPPVDPPKSKPVKKTKRRSFIMAVVLHPLVRQGLETTRKKILAEMEGLKAALAQVDEMLGGTPPEVEVTVTPTQSVSPIPSVKPEGKPDLTTMAKEMAAAAISE
jgi:hypothetical protein